MSEERSQAVDEFTENFGDIIESAMSKRGAEFTQAAIGSFQMAQLSEAVHILAAGSSLERGALENLMEGIVNLMASINARLARGVDPSLAGELMNFADVMMKRKAMLAAAMAAEKQKGGEQG